ncbi:putative manganese transporter [Pseudoalteromonas espejiana]
MFGCAYPSGHYNNSIKRCFFQVSVFVAATLLIYYYAIEHLPQLELSYLSAKSPALEVMFASVLGALPGCGGAIIVVTQFTKRPGEFWCHSCCAYCNNG